MWSTGWLTHVTYFKQTLKHIIMIPFISFSFLFVSNDATMCRFHLTPIQDHYTYLDLSSINSTRPYVYVRDQDKMTSLSVKVMKTETGWIVLSLRWWRVRPEFPKDLSANHSSLLSSSQTSVSTLVPATSRSFLMTPPLLDASVITKRRSTEDW